jgi:hypothetical protein
MPQEKSLCSALIGVLSNTSLGLPMIALAADVIAADARFNNWLSIEGKRDLSDDEMLETIDVYEDIRIQCLTAIEHFHGSADLGGLEVALSQTLETLRKFCRR